MESSKTQVQWMKCNGKLKYMLRVHTKADLDNDGMLTPDEAHRCLRRLGLVCTCSSSYLRSLSFTLNIPFLLFSFIYFLADPESNIANKCISVLQHLTLSELTSLTKIQQLTRSGLLIYSALLALPPGPRVPSPTHSPLHVQPVDEQRRTQRMANIVAPSVSNCVLIENG